jgi:hypothetical protein
MARLLLAALWDFDHREEWDGEKEVWGSGGLT